MKTIQTALAKFSFSIGLSLAFAAASPVFAQKSGSDKIYEAVQKPAEPKGGMQAFQTYLSENLTYPTESLRQKIQGTVIVDFVVEKNGSISSIDVKKGLDEATNKESLRVVANSPKWEPAYHQGEKVRQRITVPLVFKIPEGYFAADSANGEQENAKPLADKAVENYATNLKEITPEEPARPVNGLDAFNENIQKNLNYPSKAKKKGVQGKVLVEFVVERRPLAGRLWSWRTKATAPKCRSRELVPFRISSKK